MTEAETCAVRNYKIALICIGKYLDLSVAEYAELAAINPFRTLKSFSILTSSKFVLKKGFQ